MNRISTAAVTGFLCLFLATPATAQIYDNPTNLQVLPADISANELRETMKGFSLGVGLRCSDCHVGEESDPLTDYDFASDDEALKKTARMMLTMTNTLNQELLASLGDERTEVQCVTCHRGLRLPRTTAEVLTMAAEEGGVDGLTTTYGELREQYYGTHSYDFSEFLLGEFVRSRAAAGQPEQALAMLDILSTENPQSFWLQYLYGETYEREGKVEKAISHYREAMELDPAATAWVATHVEQLEAESGLAPPAPVKALPFSSDRWAISGEEFKVEPFAGREALYLRNAIARLEDAAFLNGTIEFDVYLPSEERGFSGIYWRLRDRGNGEDFYIRHHQSGNPDANQYAPLYNGSAAWQLYYGPQFAVPTEYRFEQWMPIKIVSLGDEADIYIDGDEPSLRVRLKNEAVAGGLSLWSAFSPAWFSNLRVIPDSGAEIIGTPPEPFPAPAPGTIMAWSISDAFAETRVEDVVGGPTDDRKWTMLEVEDRGYANLARVQGPAEGANTALARVVITSDSARRVPLKFGFSDRVRVYSNGRLLYAGDNSYQSRDYRYLGTIGLFEELALDLNEGDNELLFAVSEAFGGWGVMAAIEDRTGLAISP